MDAKTNTKLRGTTAQIVSGPHAGKTGQIIQEPLRRHVVIQFPNRRAITVALEQLRITNHEDL